MLAIYQANPRAFDRNMNVMRSGAVLRMPDAATVAAVSPSEATSELRRQTAAWRAVGGVPAAGAATEPGRLKLVTPSETPAAGATPGAPSAEVNALQGRVHDLEGQLADSKRLLEMKNAELARLQAQLAAKQSAQPAQPPSAAAPPPAPEAAPAPAPQAAPPAAAAPPPAVSPPAAEATPPAPEQKAPTPVPAPAASPSAAAQKVKAAHAPAAGGSMLDTLAGYWWLLLLVLVALIAIAAMRTLRSRRAAEFDDSLGRLAAAGGGGDLGPAGRGRAFAADGGGPSPPAQPMRAAPAAAEAPEATFLVEESGSHERPRLGAAAAAPAARHVASEDTISSDTAINLDQGDPLAEADFHMAYGLYDQAADLIRIAINREPGRRDLKLKLLEVFFVWGNKEQFLQTARELAATRDEAAPGEWEKILIMGKQLAPEDALFSGAAAVSGATAGGVDLDLEGGQSRVDFDLLGEPLGGEGAQGVDLDIGAAVGDQTIDSTTNVTDRNAALLENTFASATGTTRQMTARVEDMGATGEMEGPTVEQPGVAAADNPTIRQKLETAMRQAGADQTAELALDDLGLDVGAIDTVDQPGLASSEASSPDAPTLITPTGEHALGRLEDTQEKPGVETGRSTGAWQFDPKELAEATQSSLAPEISATDRLKALGGEGLDVDVGESTAVHRAAEGGPVDLDLGAASGSHAANGGLDLDVGTATVPESAFAATQRLSSEELALPDLEPVTMSEVGTKLDLARAYMDMGDPDGARNILEEVLNEGSAAQKQEAQRLMESLPG
jgi:pilus assembly protein FimV